MGLMIHVIARVGGARVARIRVAKPTALLGRAGMLIAAPGQASKPE